MRASFIIASKVNGAFAPDASELLIAHSAIANKAAIRMTLILVAPDTMARKDDSAAFPGSSAISKPAFLLTIP